MIYYTILYYIYYAILYYAILYYTILYYNIEIIQPKSKKESILCYRSCARWSRSVGPAPGKWRSGAQHKLTEDLVKVYPMLMP